MMRFVLPAIALSVGLHAGLLALAGGPNAVEHGAESAVSSTVIVFDAQPAPAVSASADADQVAEERPVEAEDHPAEPLPDKAPAGAKPVEIVKDAETEQAALEPEPVVEVPVEEPQPVVEPQQVVEPEPVVETPVEQLQAVVEPQPAVTPEPVTKPAPVQPVEAEPFVPIPRNKPPVPAELGQEQLSAEKPVRRKAKKEASTKPVKKAKSRKKPTAKADRRKAKQKPARKTASRGTSKKKTQSRAGSAGRSGGASAGEKAAYARRVLSHIQRYKRFPSGARAGKVGLKVRISASGALQSAAVRRSSGHRVLDKAAIATARRASPYPKPPGGGSFSFTVSLRYKR
ncbi:MAG: TonB family protein [Anderseniella sp.]|nr:TonB family protein [Anderseniella sp.]